MLKNHIILAGFIVALASGSAFEANAALVDYRAVIRVDDSNGTSLGYVQNDPNYWTPQLTADNSTAMILDFTLAGTSGNQTNLTAENTNQSAFPYFGLVVGRDSTNSDIGSGNLNYLYIGNTNVTNPGATPQSVPNYFSDAAGVDKQSESAVWLIDVSALTIDPVWINSDASTPTTYTFVQSNHVYAGGDPDAFVAHFPAPVTTATLHLEILSAIPQQTPVPEPLTLSLFGGGLAGLGAVRRRRKAV